MLIEVETQIQHDHISWGVDFSYHLWTKVSVRMGIIWGISVQTIHKGHVLIFYSVYI